MTFEEIVKKLKELDYSKGDIGEGYFDREVFGPVTEVFSKGGEGEGCDWERVHYFEDHDVYLSMSGYYQSYSGVDFADNEPMEVRPVQRLTTYYE